VVCLDLEALFEFVLPGLLSPLPAPTEEDAKPPRPINTILKLSVD
jgi:hypothetical protein